MTRQHFDNIKKPKHVKCDIMKICVSLIKVIRQNFRKSCCFIDWNSKAVLTTWPLGPPLSCLFFKKSVASLVSRVRANSNPGPENIKLFFMLNLAEHEI